MAGDPIAAVREQDAAGDTATLFADIRETLGVPFVNLIWRHLATMPGMLAWTWAVVKPLHQSAELREAAASLRGSVPPVEGLRQPGFVFAAAGVSAADRQVIGALVQDYTAANTVNLLCLLVVQAILACDAPGARPVRPALAVAPPAPYALPRLLGLEELSPDVRDLVLALDEFGRLAGTDAVASLYRHLAHWPGFLAIAHAALSIPHASGMLRSGHRQVRAEAAALTRRVLLPVTARTPAPAAVHREAARTAIETFTDHMIARMVFMGTTMLALPE